jgi:hypothetical protein
MPLHSTTPRLCSLPDCDKVSHAKTLCHRHYERKAECPRADKGVR